MLNLRKRFMATVGVVLCLAVGISRAQEGPSMTTFDLQTTARVLNFELLAERKKELPKYNPNFWGARTLHQKLKDVNLKVSADNVSEPKIKDERRSQPYRHFMPSLGGATGLIDMPIAYTIPKKKWVMSAQTEHFAANSKYWSLPYRKIDQANRYFTLNYGASRNIEVNADLEFWNKDFKYADAVNGTDPVFSIHDKFFLGFGSKWTFPMPNPGCERIWFAMGFRFQFFENPDRNTTEFHEYDRFQDIYFVFSTKATKELFGHLMFKYVSYDWRGGVYPSGITPLFPGYSPVNAWMQWGLAAEWFLFPDLEVFTELTKDTGVIFLGNLLQFNWNVGIRYNYKDLGVGFWAKRINFPGLDNNGIQVSWKF